MVMVAFFRAVAEQQHGSRAKKVAEFKTSTKVCVKTWKIFSRLLIVNNQEQTDENGANWLGGD
jgi:hypothetical protein